MKRTLSFMVMALALLLTQCRKPEVKFPSPVAPEGTTVSMTVTAGPGGKTDISETGAITWSMGDKLYVGFDGKYVGYLTLTSGQNTPTGWFSGNVTLPAGITEGTPQTFHFFYLGSVDYTGSLTKGTSTTVDVSFAFQEIYNNGGKLENASKHHVGYGSANGTVKDGVVTGINVTLVSKVALARFSFTEAAGKGAYDGALTLSGTGIYNKMTVNFDSEGFSCTGTVGEISLTNTTTSEKYVMLVPTSSTTGSQTLNFGGGASGTTTLANGIEANKFYGRESAIEVTVKPFVFTVDDEGTTVEFSKGNLYYNGADNSHKMNENLPSGWNFYGHQWDCYADDTGEVTESMEINLFTWGCGAWSTVRNTNDFQTGEDVTMTDWGSLAIGGYEANTWRTLTKDEWDYLLENRDDAMYLRAMLWLDEGAHRGLVILPDGTENPLEVLGSITSTSNLATYGAVFLPAAGYRGGTSLQQVGWGGYYWSSTPVESYVDKSYDVRLDLNGGWAYTYDDHREFAHAVRLVRYVR